MKHAGWALALFAVWGIAGCGGPADTKDEKVVATDVKAEKTEVSADKKPTETPDTSGVQVKKEDIVVGKGQEIAEGDLALVQYRGTLTDGKEFDSNTDPTKDPFAFRVGAGNVIKGWDQGVPGMKVGGERKLTIPYQLAYGEAGSPPAIPAKADLVFTVKLLDVVKQGEEAVFDSTDLKPGTGPGAKKGDELTLHYTGTLVNGKKFDSSKDRNEPFKFVLGQGQVIPGWDAGLVGMKVGGTRKLRIPPAIAYGEGGKPPIPGNMTLVFEVELLKIGKPTAAPQ